MILLFHHLQCIIVRVFNDVMVCQSHLRRYSHSIECVEVIQKYSNALTKCTKCTKKCNGISEIGESNGLFGTSGIITLQLILHTCLTSLTTWVPITALVIPSQPQHSQTQEQMVDFTTSQSPA
jgi:hypothetical protein